MIPDMMRGPRVKNTRWTRKKLKLLAKKAFQPGGSKALKENLPPNMLGRWANEGRGLMLSFKYKRFLHITGMCRAVSVGSRIKGTWAKMSRRDSRQGTVCSVTYSF
jgi:hypothetical protein